jgi:hypothetical protein
MAQTDIAEVCRGIAVHIEKQENCLFKELTDTAQKAGEGFLSVFKSGADDAHRKALGLPSLDLTGFEQEAPYRSQGTIKDIWHDIKHTFVKDETLSDRIRRHVESKMTPEEQKKFDDENKALAEHERKVISWAMTMMVPPPPYPQMPDTPMHKEINRRAERLENQISEEVRGQMSQTDLRRLDSQMKEYQQKNQDATRIRNLVGTGEGFRPLPTPGNAIKDYFDRVSEATERYLERAAAAK